jgi:hypothetical protein
MIAAAISCCLLVAMAAIHYAHRQRSLAERLVDALYAAAAVGYSMARAADMALVCYRRERQQIRDAHIPGYAEVRP